MFAELVYTSFLICLNTLQLIIMFNSKKSRPMFYLMFSLKFKTLLFFSFLIIYFDFSSQVCSNKCWPSDDNYEFETIRDMIGHYFTETCLFWMILYYSSSFLVKLINRAFKRNFWDESNLRDECLINVDEMEQNRDINRDLNLITVEWGDAPFKCTTQCFILIQIVFSIAIMLNVQPLFVFLYLLNVLLVCGSLFKVFNRLSTF